MQGVVVFFLCFLFISTVVAESDKQEINAKDMDTLDWNKFQEKAFLSVVYQQKTLIVILHTSYYNAFGVDGSKETDAGEEKWGQFESKWKSPNSALKISDAKCRFDEAQRLFVTPEKSDWFKAIFWVKCETPPKKAKLILNAFDPKAKIREVNTSIMFEGENPKFVILEGVGGEIKL